MANVLLTTYCNRSCSYCFAKGKVDLGKDQGDSTKNMSLEALEKVIKFYNKSQLRRFTVLGGEPTLHPEFNRIIDRLTSEKDLKSVLIFSNGLMPDQVLDAFAQNLDPKIVFALNLNSPEDHTASELSRVCKTMQQLGPRVGLGINVYKAGQKYDYLLDAVEQYNLSPHIRVGITQPILGSNNGFAAESDFPEIAEDLLQFAEKAYKKNITFSFDCGFRFCMFTLEQHKELLRFGINFKSNCTPIIDIGPDLSVWRCFPLSSDISGKLPEFQTRNQLIDFYNNKYKTYMPMGNKPECPQCRYRLSSLCSGGCLSRTLLAFQR